VTHAKESCARNLYRL